MAKGKAPEEREPLAGAACRPRLPPSLSRVSGYTDLEVEEEDCCHRLEQVMRALPLQVGAAPKIKNLARDLYESFRLGKLATGARRKTRSANPTNAKRHLRYIEQGSNTLLRRLRNAPTNVFQAWADADDNAVNPREATKEWLSLQRLLENAAKRAKRAAETNLAKAGVSENRGRPPDHIAASVTLSAALAFEELTGRDPGRNIDRDTGKPYGEFHEFLEAVFEALGINSSPDASNMQLQADRKKIWEGPIKK
jgi:hypothetical protein